LAGLFLAQVVALTCWTQREATLADDSDAKAVARLPVIAVQDAVDPHPQVAKRRLPESDSELVRFGLAVGHVRGSESLRLDRADRLATYFGLTQSKGSRKGKDVRKSPAAFLVAVSLVACGSGLLAEDRDRARQEAIAAIEQCGGMVGVSERSLGKKGVEVHFGGKSRGRSQTETSDPFFDVKPPSQRNDARKFFVTREAADRVLAACPDAEWRLIFALCRFGGLRCPSELLPLTWNDVDWERNRFLVHSPKTEHLDGGGDRWVPIFPELRPHFEEVFDLAEAGVVNIVVQHRGPNVNLRTQLQRIVCRAGLIKWPKLFQNLRASRQTELAAEYPLRVFCTWIGNSEAVAEKH
jgi:hypothetical protein